jgi:cysteine desulfurase/selenocysteine lyase
MSTPDAVSVLGAASPAEPVPHAGASSLPVSLMSADGWRELASGSPQAPPEAWPGASSAGSPDVAASSLGSVSPDAPGMALPGVPAGASSEAMAWLPVSSSPDPLALPAPGAPADVDLGVLPDDVLMRLLPATSADERAGAGHANNSSGFDGEADGLLAAALQGLSFDNGPHAPYAFAPPPGEAPPAPMRGQDGYIPGLADLERPLPGQQAAVLPAGVADPGGASTGRPGDRGAPARPAAPGAGALTGPEVEGIRADFPILRQMVNGHPLAWLDNAATTQKPQCVIDAISSFYERDNSNVHRAAHALAARATDAYEGARATVQRLLKARSPREIVFVRGTTEAINLVAQSYGRQVIGPGDEVLVTTLEHHANILPWQLLCAEKGAHLRPIPITDAGEVDLGAYARMLGPKTRIVALSQISNVLGTVLPVREMTAMAHAAGARVLVDGAQSIAHLPVDVCSLGCDFFVFSGHKIYGPTGVGALYGRLELLDAMPPWQGGGNMIDRVTFESSTYAPVPAKFEAGTPILAGAVGLGVAIEYVQRIGLERIAQHEHGLLQAAMAGLAGIPGLRLYGTAPNKAAVAAFLLDGVAPEKVGERLNDRGIAVRVGHHCAQPTMDRYGVRGMVRPSFAFYNTFDEVERLLAAVRELRGAT